MTSGSRPIASLPHIEPVRPSPVCTSSATTTAPASRRRGAQRAGEGRRRRMHAALALDRLGDDRRRRQDARCACRSAPSAGRARRARRPRSPPSPNGQRCDVGNGRWCTAHVRSPSAARGACAPDSSSAPCVIPWYAPPNAITPARPVAVRASLIAASTASAPVGPQNWIRPSRSDGGRTANSASMNASRSGVERSSVVSGAPERSASWSAATTAGWRWPSASEPAPARQSRYVRPDVSRTNTPSPVGERDRQAARVRPGRGLALRLRSERQVLRGRRRHRHGRQGYLNSRVRRT